MARTKTTNAPTTQDDRIDTGELQKAGDAMTKRALQLASVDAQFDVALDYNLDVFVACIRQDVAETGSRLVRIGRMLLLIREHETPEVFRAALDRAGLADRFAYGCINAARKLGNHPKLQQLGSSKMLELVVEDDESLEKLEKGGTIAGQTLDDIDRMTVREVRAKLRKERIKAADKIEVLERKLEEKDDRIDQLAGRSRKTGVDDRGRALYLELVQVAAHAASSLHAYAEAAHALDQHYADHQLALPPDYEAMLETTVEQIGGAVQGLVDQYGEG